MPLLVTDGLGLAVSGPGVNLQLVSIVGGLDYFDLIFSAPIVSITGPAADYTKYGIAVADLTSSMASLTGVSIVGGNVRLTTTQCTNGGTYKISLPAVGFFDGGDAWVGPYSMNAIAVGLAPQALSARVIDARTVDIIFNEAVVQSEASVVANYNISPTLAVSAVTFINATTYRLTTARQTRGTNYTVTVSNIHDLEGDLI